MTSETDRTVEKLLRQQAALAKFGSFAFKETNLFAILSFAFFVRDTRFFIGRVAVAVLESLIHVHCRSPSA